MCRAWFVLLVLAACNGDTATRDAAMLDATSLDATSLDATSLDARSADAPSADAPALNGQVCGASDGDRDAGAVDSCGDGLVCCRSCGRPDCIDRCRVPCLPDNSTCDRDGCPLIP